MNLFDQVLKDRQQKDAPLAARMRPRTLDEYVGQQHIIGQGRLLRRSIQADQLGSLIFYGPPGTGKTEFAKVLAAAWRDFRVGPELASALAIGGVSSSKTQGLSRSPNHSTTPQTSS